MSATKVLGIFCQETYRSRLASSLGDVGFFVQMAGNFTEALELARRLNFEILLTDADLPDRERCKLLSDVFGMVQVEVMVTPSAGADGHDRKLDISELRIAKIVFAVAFADEKLERCRGNSIVSVVDDSKMPTGRILVPLLFTQSGIKPLTSLEMSRRYVELYDKFCESDAVVVCGYGFNGDDGHINCLFRNLIEVDKKNVFIPDYARDRRPKPNIHGVYCRKLRLKSPSPLLHVISVDSNRMTLSDELWHKVIAEQIRAASHRVGFAARLRVPLDDGKAR